MARKLFIAGNWKMNTSAAEAAALATDLVGRLGAEAKVDLAVCPPSVYLTTVRDVLKGSAIALGAQNAWYEDNGAYTGELSTAMLADVGCAYVIVGHSERRHILGETDAMINRKVLKVLAGGLKPILCVGELLEQRKADQTDDVVARQVKLGLKGVAPTDMARVTIAYEPVWAIGTGEVATPQQAQAVHAMIRDLLADLFGKTIADATRIQYGGSVKASNAGDLLACKDIDGALVGGASLKAAEFAGIVAAGAKL
ncbi:MAG: triose-phosphate isomerase [Planctomycetes bacterium]|nr:triose-phosphate isomerase [Planctomycetota bacterium]